MSTTFTAQEANREYPDAEITLDDLAADDPASLTDDERRTEKAQDER